MTYALLGAALAGVLLMACSSDEQQQRDLPEGWERATALSIVQSACGGSAIDAHDESFSVTPSTDARAVHYQDAHFRCEQRVCAYTMSAEDGEHVLLQPCDMDPAQVAACDCLYAIDFELAGAAGEVSLWRRWDNLNDDNQPVSIPRAATE